MVDQIVLTTGHANLAPTQQYLEVRSDKLARRAVKQSRWLLLRNPENLDPGQAASLDELLARLNVQNATLLR